MCISISISMWKMESINHHWINRSKVIINTFDLNLLARIISIQVVVVMMIQFCLEAYFLFIYCLLYSIFYVVALNLLLLLRTETMLWIFWWHIILKTKYNMDKQSVVIKYQWIHPQILPLWLRLKLTLHSIVVVSKSGLIHSMIHSMIPLAGSVQRWSIIPSLLRFVQLSFRHSYIVKSWIHFVLYISYMHNILFFLSTS